MALLTAHVAAATPIVTLGAVTDATPHGATLHGTIDPQGEAVSYAFEYVDGNGRLDSWAPHETAGAGTLRADAGPTDVSATLTGLGAGTPYFVLLEANGVDSQQGVFGTQPVLPGTSIRPPTQVTDTSAFVHGSGGLSGIPTDFHFEYGTTTSYGTTTLSQEMVPAPNCSVDPLPTPPPPMPPPYQYTSSMDCWVGESDAAWGSGAELDGLQPGTTYHVRVVAHNAVGTSYSADETFTTLPDPNAPAPPSLDKPTLAGRALVGDTLVCQSDVAFVYDWAWLRDGVPIPHATSARHALGPADAGHRIACRIDAFVDYVELTAVSDDRLVGRPVPMAAISQRAHVAADGLLVLHVTCRSHSHGCRGVLALRLPRPGQRMLTLAHARIALAAGSRASVRLRLNRAGMRLLDAAPSRRLHAEADLGGSPSELTLGA